MTGPLPLDPADLEAVLRPRAQARPLPARAYVDPAVLRWEVEHFFEGAWVCAGREEEAPSPGDLFTATVGNESVLVARGEDGRVRGFFNVCQHRGSRLVTEERRAGAARLICPYHSWTYDLQGNLRAAQHMKGAVGFDRRLSGLQPVPTEGLEGWVFVNVSGTAGPLRAHLGNLPQAITPYAVSSLRSVRRVDYDVAANWKLLSENYQECYHCPSIHPELVRVTPYTSGRYDRPTGSWIGGPMDLMEGCTTMSLSGRSDRPPIPGLPEADRRVVRYYTVLPNLWISLHPDYVMTHRLWPLAPDRTRVVCEWLFHPAAMDRPGFDPSDAVEFWDLVNRQDFGACERVQLGVGSRGFRGGWLSDREDGVHALSALLAASYLAGRIVRADQLPTEARAGTAALPA